MTASPPPPARPTTPGPAGPATGPVGEVRSIGLVIFLTIITIGIWQLVWSYQTGSELRRHAGTGIGGVGYVFITLLILPATMFLLPNEVADLYRRQGQVPPVTAWVGLWVLLPVLGPIIWYVQVQRAVNEYWQSRGAT
ncbi:MAG: DUF4234 domain-containing protein [Actinomycetota bacterium]